MLTYATSKTARSVCVSLAWESCCSYREIVIELRWIYTICWCCIRMSTLSSWIVFCPVLSYLALILYCIVLVLVGAELYTCEMYQLISMLCINLNIFFISVVRDSELFPLIMWHFGVVYFWPTLYISQQLSMTVSQMWHFTGLFFWFCTKYILLFFIVSWWWSFEIFGYNNTGWVTKNRTLCYQLLIKIRGNTQCWITCHFKR